MSNEIMVGFMHAHVAQYFQETIVRPLRSLPKQFLKHELYSREGASEPLLNAPKSRVTPLGLQKLKSPPSWFQQFWV